MRVMGNKMIKESCKTSKEMEEKHKVCAQTLAVFRHNYKGTRFIKKSNKILLFNETEMIRIYEKRIRLWDEAHSLYYELKLNHKMGQRDQARAFHKVSIFERSSINMFLTYSLWSLVDGISITAVKGASKMLRAYHKWATKEIIDKIIKKKEKK